jgi:hypothetical protein
MLSRSVMDQTVCGQATDIVLDVTNVKLWNTGMENNLALLTGQSLEVIAQKLSCDWYFSADEAVQFDMIDYVLLPSPRKRAITQQPTCLLGSFEGCEEQRYQYQSRNNSNQKSSGGWRSQRRIKKSKDYLITAPSNVPLHMM